MSKNGRMCCASATVSQNLGKIQMLSVAVLRSRSRRADILALLVSAHTKATLASCPLLLQRSYCLYYHASAAQLSMNDIQPRNNANVVQNHDFIHRCNFRRLKQGLKCLPSNR